MKLRRQLLLVSLLTLSLPWAGCQYVREMEAALREGQSVALLATAQAVANRIANEPNLLQELQQPSAQIYSDNEIYAHDFSNAIILDGYDDEWRDRKLESKTWKKNQFRVELQAGSHNRDLYLFVRVDDADLLYYNPNLAELTQSDHLILRTVDEQSDPKDYIINTSAPGMINAYYLQRSYDAQDEIIETYMPEHRIKGIWQERRGGYQLELQLPLTLTHGYLGLAAVNRDTYHNSSQDRDTTELLGSITAESLAEPLVKKNNVLTEALAVFASNDLRLRITGRNQWLIAEAGKLQSPNKIPLEKQGIVSWLIRNLLSRQDLPDVDTPEYNGRLDAVEIAQALDGVDAHNWYRYGVHNLGRALVPITTYNRIIGTVIVEQTSASMLTLTNTAFQRLFFYTLLATLFAGVGLISYASWLSLRIRRLSRAADSAMREDGKLENQFPVSTVKDELGDLHRSYAQLLTRLQEYTDYLRTLSNKLSHELRTPLAVVRSSLDNLDNETLDAQARIFATRAQEGSQRLSAILNAISSASRVEESIRASDMESFPLDKVVKELSIAYKDIALQTVACNIASGEDFSLYGSADLIVQMIDKLFDNACDFCPSTGKIAIALTKSKEAILLVVSNDGPLLPQKMQSQLFDSLVSLRDKETETPNHKIHLGLGLHIVRLIVEVHHARVVARNRKDLSGVEFEVSFPVGADAYLR